MSSSRKKPRKPNPSFPLTAHNNGQWCKKIRGKIHFFGVWENQQAALDHYLRVAADLHAGRKPRDSNLAADAVMVKGVCNAYLTYQFQKVQDGNIRPSSFDDCRAIVESFAKAMGPARAVSDLAASDFQSFRNRLSQHGSTGRSKGLGVYGIARAISIVRSMFKYAYDAALIDMPVRYGPGFNKPSVVQVRKARARTELTNGKRLFEPPELRLMLETATQPLRAMILLGINGGLGNADCARLPIAAVNLERGILEFPRPKTGVERIVPLWPETIQALRQVLAERPKPAAQEAEELLFVTAFGRPWVRENTHLGADKVIRKVIAVDALGQELDKLLRRLELKRKGIGFYALRHTFRTWADEVRDQHAIHRIMGHAIPGMSGIYVEKIELHRLRAVVDHVRRKLFGEPAVYPSEGQVAPAST